MIKTKSKQEVKMQNKNVCLLLVTAIFVFTFMSFASAAIAYVSPVAGSNISGTPQFVVNCSLVNGTDITGPSIDNSSWYWNTTGTWDLFLTRSGFTCSANACWVTLRTDDTGIVNGRGSINCSIGNATTKLSAVSGVLTIDNVNPSVSVTVSRNSESVGRVIDYTTSVTDATSGLTSSSCTAVDPASTSHTLLIGSTGNLEFTNSIIPGTWTLTCTGTDYAGNTASASQTVKVSSMGYAVGTIPTSDKNNSTTYLIIGGLIILGIYLYNKK
jgi:hypothetical protein